MDLKRENISSGIRETVGRVISTINLDSVCKTVAESRDWGEAKTREVENNYREILSNHTLYFEGHGVITYFSNDTALLWAAHCLQAEKYASDMSTLAQAIVSFRGKTLEEKFPGLCD